MNAIEARLKPIIQEGLLAPTPQSLIEIKQLITAAMAFQLITAEENRILSDFEHFGNINAQVVDFNQILTDRWRYKKTPDESTKAISSVASSGNKRRDQKLEISVIDAAESTPRNSTKRNH